MQCQSEDLEQSTTVYKLANENVTQVIIERLLPFTTYTCCASIETTMANSTTICLRQRTPEDGNKRVLHEIPVRLYNLPVTMVMDIN